MAKEMEYRSYLPQRTAEVNDHMDKGMTKLLAHIQKLARNNADKPKGSEQHLQVQTGTLRRSITFELSKSYGGDPEGKVGIMTSKGGSKALVYAVVHELGLGTSPGYPFLLPAAEEAKQDAGKYFE